MFIKTIATSTALLCLGTAAAFASGVEARVYPYATAANFCPSGLQPISIDGVICCGTPNQSVSYQSMKTHSVVRRARATRTVRRTSNMTCPVGEKGCYSN